MNVISSSSIDRHVATLTDPVIRPLLRQWLIRVLPKHIKRTPALLERVRHERDIAIELGKKAKREVVVRLTDAFGRGEQLLKFNPLRDEVHLFGDEVRRVIDWLDSVPEWDRHLKRIDRMSYTDAVALSADWHRRLLTLLPDADDPDVVEELKFVETLAGGGRIVELSGPVALLREGRLMGHCVGGRGYVEAVRSGATRIFSVRDAGNAPHVTIEVRRSHAVQIKGKGNDVPVERWADIVRPFVKRQNWSVSWDGNRIGLLTIAGRTVDHPDEIVDACLSGGLLNGASFHSMFPNQALQVLIRRLAELSATARVRLLDGVIANTAAAKSLVDSNVVVGPNNLDIQRWKHVLPGVLLDAMQTGIFAGCEDRIAQELGTHFDTILDAIEKAPHHIHLIEVFCMSGDKRKIVDQAAAFSGRLPRLIQMRSMVEAARRQRYAAISSSIRQATSPSVKAHLRAARSWAAELSQLQIAKPENIENSRSQFAAGVVI